MHELLNVLFLCTGNSARSILAEAMLNAQGKGRFAAYSAGSHPAGVVNPNALRELARRNLPATGFRSKSWEEFAAPDAPKMDLVITVCDNAAGETCPIWPGAPLRAHWGVPDPAAVRGTLPEIEQAFREAYDSLEQRIRGLLSLPLKRLDPRTLKLELDRIGIH